MLNPTREELEAIAGLHGNVHFEKIMGWLRIALVTETEALLSQAGGSDELFERRGQCRAQRELIDTIANARKTLESYRKF